MEDDSFFQIIREQPSPSHSSSRKKIYPSLNEVRTIHLFVLIQILIKSSSSGVPLPYLPSPHLQGWLTKQPQTPDHQGHHLVCLRPSGVTMESKVLRRQQTQMSDQRLPRRETFKTIFGLDLLREERPLVERTWEVWAIWFLLIQTWKRILVDLKAGKSGPVLILSSFVDRIHRMSLYKGSFSPIIALLPIFFVSGFPWTFPRKEWYKRMSHTEM